MASESFATRAELRRRLRAKMGMSTDETINGQTTDQLNEYLREAAVMVRSACEWKRLISEFYFTTTIDVRFYNYPDGVGPGDVTRLDLWDGDKFCPLRRRVIFPALDNHPDYLTDDPDAEAATRGEPVFWEDSSQQTGSGDNIVIVPAIELNPLPDEAYRIKVEAQAKNQQLTAEDQLCTVDADCIVWLAFADYLDHHGESARAEKQRAKAQRHLLDLAGSQRVGQTIKLGMVDTIKLRFSGRRQYRYPLNFDTSLSQTPP